MSIVPSPNVWKEISLEALRHNLETLCSRLGADTRLLAVVKSNAYGHDMEQISLEAQKYGITDFGVSNINEAAKLRQTIGPDAQIIILEPAYPGQEEAIIQNNIIPVVSSREFIVSYNRQAQAMKTMAPLHLALDTGMGRIGAHNDQEVDTLVRAIQDSDNLDPCGIFSHFSSADDTRGRYTNMQADKFKRWVQFISQRLGRRMTLHAANSAAAISRPDLHFDMVRAGIAMYGINPFAPAQSSSCSLIPVMSVRARINHIKEVEKDTCISYSCTHKTDRKTRIATISIGYGHGFSRLLSNKAQVIIGGRKYPIVGNVTMSQIMADIAYADKSIRPGDIATIIGQDCDEYISAEEVASLQGTIAYEVVCGYCALEARIV